MRDVWGLLDNHRAEIVFSGHDHLYERFARQMSDCAADSTNGVHNIVAGTGGAELYNFVRASANSEERIMKFGVVRFTLRPAQIGRGVPRRRRLSQRSRSRHLPLE